MILRPHSFRPKCHLFRLYLPQMTLLDWRSPQVITTTGFLIMEKSYLRCAYPDCASQMQDGITHLQNGTIRLDGSFLEELALVRQSSNYHSFNCGVCHLFVEKTHSTIVHFKIELTQPLSLSCSLL